MGRFLSAGENILLTLWVGGLWITGYLVVPALFASLDNRMLAGDLAGSVFSLMSWVGLACGGLLLAGVLLRERGQSFKAWRLWVLVAMLSIVAIGLFVLQPQMQALKAQGIASGSVQAIEFGRLHGVSSLSSGLWQVNELLFAGAVKDTDVANAVDQLAVGFLADFVNGRRAVVTLHTAEADLNQLMVRQTAVDFADHALGNAGIADHDHGLECVCQGT